MMSEWLNGLSMGNLIMTALFMDTYDLEGRDLDNITDLSNQGNWIPLPTENYFTAEAIFGENSVLN